MAAHEITTPFPTPERVAQVLGVPKARAAKLIRWAREVASESSEKVDGSTKRIDGKVILGQTANR